MSLSRISRGLAVGVLAAGLSLSSVSLANAEEKPVNGVSLAWGLSSEQGGGAYFGGCNFLSAGKAGNTGSARVWTEADGFYSASSGKVSILKDGASGPVAPTWATKCLDKQGNAVRTSAGSSSNNYVLFSDGSGKVNRATGTATISWEGSFTSAFYGGMTYWHATNPTLEVKADGTGVLSATLGGFGASMEDLNKWEPLSEVRIPIATLTGVKLTDTGFTITPDFKGVKLTNVTNQLTTGTEWGSFPEPFVGFHLKTGQSSYWYSSGGAADPKKPATALVVGWAQPTTEPSNPGTGAAGAVDVTVTVPKVTAPDPAALKLAVSGAASLGEARKEAGGFTAAGALPTVTVSDTRAGGTWSVSGKVSSFNAGTDSIPANALGWKPKSTSESVQVGKLVSPNAPGLGTSATLGSGQAGTVELGADLSFVAPAETVAGNYKAKLTLTAIG